MRPLLLVLLFWLGSAEAAWETKIVYGEDGRFDFHELPHPSFRGYFASSLAIVKDEHFGPAVSGRRAVLAPRFGEWKKLCGGERFFDQPSLAFCSAVLVAPDLALTAGHCYEKPGRCEAARFVFGYRVERAGEYPAQIEVNNIYNCREVLALEAKEGGPDYALVRLDRPVRGGVPAALRARGKIASGAPVFALGYPGGLPAKLSIGARVRAAGKREYFPTNLDVMYRSSGSPVFHQRTGRLEGILIGGDPTDFVLDEKRGCYVSHRCGDRDCAGEDVLEAAVIHRALGRLPR